MDLIDAKINDKNKDSEVLRPERLSSRAFNLKSAEIIQSQIGDIEAVRKRIGLSKRKMCQLLLIDPSTWSRWTTGKTKPPPYVYRTLQWGLALMEKYPELHPLANYEKFEQLKKIEDLEAKIHSLEKPHSKENSDPKSKITLQALALFSASLVVLNIWLLLK